MPLERYRDNGSIMGVIEEVSRYDAQKGQRRNLTDAFLADVALRYVEKVGIERIASYEHALLEYATPRLAAIPGVRLIGTADEKASVLSFVLAVPLLRRVGGGALGKDLVPVLSGTGRLLLMKIKAMSTTVVLQHDYKHAAGH